jgi:DNA-binding transcriptional ArsR family regulator
MDQTFAFLGSCEEWQMNSPHIRVPSRRFLRHGMLPQIAAFEAVVRLGSATRAAEALCIAQPTLSGHLRKLSEALGVRLFDIRGKRLVPTDAARSLLEAAHEVFAALERCERALASQREPLGQADVTDRAVPASFDRLAGIDWRGIAGTGSVAAHRHGVTERAVVPPH